MNTSPDTPAEPRGGRETHSQPSDLGLLILIAITNIWEIGSDSVGNRSDSAVVGPGQESYVGGPPRATDKTGCFA